MNEMVERVAKAIGTHVHVIAGSCDLQAAARAAIEAMREPTERMLKEAHITEADYKPHRGSCWPAMKSRWIKMIDEALR